MGRWIKQNLVLVSGIVLPLLLVAGFFLLGRAPGTLAEPPEFDFVLVAYSYDYQLPADYYLTFEVRDGHLRGRAVPTDETGLRAGSQSARIFRYDAEANAFEEILYDLPEGLEELQESIPLSLGDLGALTLDKRVTSPDGFQFETAGYRGGSGLLGEMFGMRRQYESRYLLRKGEAWLKLPEPARGADTYPYDLQFMGWILDESPSQ